MLTECCIPLTDQQATMKIIQLTYDTSYGKPDFGEADLVQLLTGWHPVVYTTQRLFKEQEIVIKLLEELQAGNIPAIEYEPIEDPAKSESTPEHSDDAEDVYDKTSVKRERRLAKAPKPESTAQLLKQPTVKQQQRQEATSTLIDGDGLLI